MEMEEEDQRLAGSSSSSSKRRRTNMPSGEAVPFPYVRTVPHPNKPPTTTHLFNTNDKYARGGGGG
jgi:hypothetical protein